MSPRLLVVGGGITGLAAAWEGVCAGAEVTVVDYRADAPSPTGLQVLKGVTVAAALGPPPRRVADRA